MEFNYRIDFYSAIKKFIIINKSPIPIDENNFLDSFLLWKCENCIEMDHRFGYDDNYNFYLDLKFKNEEDLSHFILRWC